MSAEEHSIHELHALYLIQIISRGNAKQAKKEPLDDYSLIVNDESLGGLTSLLKRLENLKNS